MTGTNCYLFTHNQSRSYLNHLVFCLVFCVYDKVKDHMGMTFNNFIGAELFLGCRFLTPCHSLLSFS
jgi:hypothetical protein